MNRLNPCLRQCIDRSLFPRFESAKLLLELDETVNTAVDILESLLEENDSVPDVYQLLAMCLFGGGEHREVSRLV